MNTEIIDVAWKALEENKYRIYRIEEQSKIQNNIQSCVVTFYFEIDFNKRSEEAKNED